MHVTWTIASMLAAISSVSSSPLGNATALRARHEDLTISFFFSDDCTQEVGSDNGHAVAEIAYVGNQDNYMKCHGLPSGLGSLRVTGSKTTGCDVNPPNGKSAYDIWLVTNTENDCGTEHAVATYCAPTGCVKCNGNCGSVEYTLFTQGGT